MIAPMAATTPTPLNSAPRATPNASNGVSELIAIILTQLQVHTGRDFSHYQSENTPATVYGVDFWQAIADIVAEVQECRARGAQLQLQADVLQQISEVVIAVDQEERITYLNAAAAAQYEVDPSAVVGQPLRYLYRDEWLQPEAAIVADAALAERGYWRGENRHIKRNGTVLYVESTLSLLRDQVGLVIGLLACTRDITARKQTEMALQASEARYRQLADAMPQLVWTANAAGVVEYYNIRIHDYDPAVWQGAYGFDWERLLHPDDRAPTLDAWQRAAQRKETYSFEHRLHMADGSWRWHLSRAVLVRGSLHETRWYGTATDIHEQKQTEEALREREARLNTILQNMPAAVYMFSTDEHYLYVNHHYEQLAGLTNVEIQGKSIDDMFTPETAAMLRANDQHVLLTKRPLAFEEAVTLHGEIHTYASVKIPLLDGNGEPYALLGISTDITDHKQAERNQQFLLDLDTHTRLLADEHAILTATTERLGQYLGVTHCTFTEIELEHDRGVVLTHWRHTAELPSLVGTYQISAVIRPVMAAALADGEPVVINNTALDPLTKWLVEPYMAHQAHSIMLTPFIGQSTVLALVGVADAQPRAWRTDEITLLESVVGRIWPLVVKARAEAALRVSEAVAHRHLDELEAIYKTAPVGLCVMDKELRYVRINERLAAMNGYPAAYHIGRTGRELFPDLAEKTEAALRRIFTTGEAVIGVELTGELPTQPGVQRTWLESWLPLHNEVGEVVAINIVIEEMTEQKQAEVALRTSAERLRLATEAGGIGIFDHDLRTNQTEISEIYAHITGFPVDAIVTREAWLARIHPADRALVAAIWTQSQASGASYYYECRIIRPDGVLVWIEVNAWVTQDELGNSVRITGAIRDITERKLAVLHQQFLLDLSATLRKLSDPTVIEQTIVKRLGAYLGASHCRLSAIDLAADRATLLAAWSAHDEAPDGDITPLSAYISPAYRTDAQLGRTLVITDATLDDRPLLPQRFLLERGLSALIRVPCLSEGLWVASLQVMQNTPRAWRADEVRVVESVVHHFWPLIEKAQAAEALRTSERRFRQLADTMPQVVWTAHADGAITYINQQWAIYSGMTLAETQTQGMWPALHPADLAANRAQWQHALARREPYEAEVRMRRQDGVYRWFLERAHPMHDETGAVQQWFGVSMDITDRKAAEEALAAHAGELRVITDNILGFISYIDQEQYYRFVNAAYEELYGRPREQILGQSLHAMLGDAVYEQVQPYIVRALQGETLQFEATLAYPTGTRTIWATYVPDVNQQGVVQGFYALVTDISERKAFEEALRQSEETAQQRLAELEAIYDTAPIGLCVLDRELRWVRINERLAEINGFPAAAHLGRSVRELLPELAPAAEPILYEILVSNQPVRNMELHGETPAQPGVERIWREHWFPLHDHTGLVIGINVVAEEITERKRQEQQLKELNATLEERVRERTAALEQANQELARSNQELEQFTYAAAHDLKSPLRGIQHLVHWLNEDAAAVLSPASQKHLTLLRGRVQRMETLLDDMLAYSRVGQIHYTLEKVDTHLLVHNLIDLLAPPAGFIIAIPVRLPMLLTMRAPLETVLRNLLSNTIKHHHQPAGGYVEVTAQHQGAWVEFAIRDNGPGIDLAFHERIFGMFQTLQPRDQVEGSGIGLALVKKILESYGGQIRVESTQGTGTTFRFTWPNRQ